PEADEDGKPLGTGLRLPVVDARGAAPKRDRGEHRRETKTVEHVAVDAKPTERKGDSHVCDPLRWTELTKAVRCQGGKAVNLRRDQKARTRAGLLRSAS